MYRAFLNLFFTLTLLVLFKPIETQGQNKKIDSLTLVLKKAKIDTARCGILSAMIDAETDDNKWPAYNDELIETATAGLSKVSNKDSVAKILKKHLAAAFSNKGFMYNKRGNISKALEYYGKSIKIEEEIGDKVSLSITLNNVGYIYKKQGDNTAAMKCYRKCLDIQTKIFLPNGEWADKGGIAASYNNIGSICMSEGDNIGALEFFNKGLKLLEEVGNKNALASTINNIGMIHMVNKEYSKALECFNKSVQIRKEINHRPGMASSLNNISAAYLKQKKLTPALKYAEMSLKIGKEIGYPENIMGPAERLADIYKKTGNHKKALENYELFIQMRDSINNETNRKAGIRSQLKYEYEKQAAADSVAHEKESEIKNIQLQKQTAEIKAKKNQQYALFGGLGLVIIFAGFMYNRFKITQKQKVIIEEQKEVVEEQKKLVEERQKEVMDSINYEKRIQRALMASEKHIDKTLKKLMNHEGK